MSFYILDDRILELISKNQHSYMSPQYTTDSRED